MNWCQGRWLDFICAYHVFFHSGLIYSGGGGAVLVLMRFSKLQQQDGAVRRGCKVTSMVVLARLYVAILAWFSEHRLHLAVVQQDIRLGLAPQRNWQFFIFWILALSSLERSNIPLCHIDIQTARQVYLSLLSSLCFVFYSRLSRKVWQWQCDIRGTLLSWLNEIYSISRGLNAAWKISPRRETQTSARG